MVALALVWLIAQLSNRKGSALVRLLLVVQFLLLAAVLAFSVVAKPSSNPGVLAGVSALIAVSTMATQYAPLRLGLPGAISTAGRTGNWSIPCFPRRLRPIKKVAASSLRLSARLRELRPQRFP